MDPDELVESVLGVVEQIPPGRVASYGDVALAAGTTARNVGRIMARWGHDVPWWRVTSATGRLPEHLLAEASARWADEGVELSASGLGCRLQRHRAVLRPCAG